MLAAGRRLSSIGTERAPATEARYVIVTNRLALFFMATNAFYLVAAIPWLPATAPLVLIQLVITALWPLVLLLNARGWYWVARSSLLLATAQLVVVSLLLGPAAGVHYFLLPAAGVPFVQIPPRHRFVACLLALVPAGVFVVLHSWLITQPPLMAVGSSFETVIRYLVTTGLAVFGVGISLHHYDAVSAAEAKADDEYRRSENLLRNVLPDAIAQRLKSHPGTIADRFDQVTVLFADLVNFTTLSQAMPATQLVALLDEVFSEFDRLADRLGLEKIKTIGDAYMLAAGIPSARPDHVGAVCTMALEMQRVLTERFQQRYPELQLRIGVHTGPVVAGVIGKRKFIYDLWGDTVNTASRMESHGVPGRVQVTADVRARLDSRFVCEPRGEIEVKGKGKMEVFLLCV